MAPFYRWGSTAPRLYSHFKEAVYFLLLSSQKFLALILSTSERRKAESTLEPSRGFEQETLGLGIQHLKPLHHLMFFALFTIQTIEKRSANISI